MVIELISFNFSGQKKSLQSFTSTFTFKRCTIFLLMCRVFLLKITTVKEYNNHRPLSLKKYPNKITKKIKLCNNINQSFFLQCFYQKIITIIKFKRIYFLKVLLYTKVLIFVFLFYLQVNVLNKKNSVAISTKWLKIFAAFTSN